MDVNALRLRGGNRWTWVRTGGLGEGKEARGRICRWSLPDGVRLPRDASLRALGWDLIADHVGICLGRAQAVEERHEWAAAYHDGGQAGPMTAPTFRTDVSIRAPAAQPLLDRPYNARGLSSSEYLDSAAENVNKQIDSDVKAMLDAFEALVSLSRVSAGGARCAGCAPSHRAAGRCATRTSIG